jgi:outer membrane receptor protein involved in Fe transport
MSTGATFALNVDNLFDKNYWAAGDSVNATPSIAAGLPRVIRASATLDF